MKPPDHVMRRSPIPLPTKRWEGLARGMTIADLIDWCAQRGLDPSEVEFTGGGHVTWMAPETTEEMERRLAHWQTADERHEKWERETWERLNATYGPNAVTLDPPPEEPTELTPPPGIASPTRSRQ